MISLILSGGVGSRLWPLSREKLPKQFSHLFGESLFVQTSQRLQRKGEVLVCTGEAMRGLTESAIRNENLKIGKVFYEPVGRNTAPAIGIVCHYLARVGRSDEVMGVFPSDHWIEKTDVFYKALDLAADCAKQNKIVTIGLKPTYPATGFGYVECDSAEFSSQQGLQAFAVKAFKEKPSKDLAEAYIADGHYFWNGGMFVFQVSTMINAFKTHLPEMWALLETLDDDLSNLETVYKKIQPESIDFGIMEKHSEQVNIPCDMGWSDLGSWDDIASATERGALDVTGSVLTENAEGCYTYSDNGKTICLASVDDLIVVDTKDALLVTKKGETQTVKGIVEQLKNVAPNLTETHVYEYRPWGFYQNIHEEETFKAKVIQVDPGQQLSYQSHVHREEIWVTVEGEGEVVLNEEVIPVSRGKIIQIPQGAKHRMRNTGKQKLKFVEVQMGDYFGEDDIIRYQDDYQRA